MDELTNVFADFQKQVQEISDHAQQVHRVEFFAKLKNGTSFNFSFNSDTFNRLESGKRTYRPVSIFNAIIDIIGGSAAIFLLVYYVIVLEEHSASFLPASLWSIVTFCFFIGSFVVSCLYHLFDRESSVRHVFSTVAEALKIITLALVNISSVLLMNPAKIIPALLGTLLFAAMAFLFLSMGTQGGSRASLSFAVMLPFIALMGQITMLTVSTAILFALWSLVNLLASSSLRARTITIFAIMGMLTFAMNCLLVL
ncbi:hypothetical protein [uncultured Sphaerochaeta sp.]|uniref:hypothetical protein n=1 Tax=uncultured Sphaerochaeta sp. TaxID=886478 RepID=UPI002A0A6935|nr:hypothetical protein [uncultured Sphaerochaeta sp.]